MSDKAKNSPPSYMDDTITRVIKNMEGSSLEGRKQTIVSLLNDHPTKDDGELGQWIWLAASMGQTEIVETLCTSGLSPTNRGATTALERLFTDPTIPNSNDIYRTVAMLTQQTPTFSPERCDLLSSPSASGNLALVKAFFDHIFPRLTTEQREYMLEAVDEEAQNTPLLRAVLNYRFDIASLLLQHGADPDCHDLQRRTNF